jgi:CubicO group peptidase (beta-lactamase class C family)
MYVFIIVHFFTFTQDMDLDKGVEAYLKAKENDVKPNNATFANLLSLTAGFGEQGLFTYMYI